MSIGEKVFAVIQVMDGRPIVDLGDTAHYMTVTTEDGLVRIIERKPQE